MGLGDLYMTKKMPVEALDRYDRARELAPMRHDINIRIGRFHHAQGNLPLAIEFYAASLNGAESGREATASLNALGNAYLESADLEMAERSFLQALRLSPDDRAAKAGLLSAKR
jgi:tetratricopeptide (TPR) repeat protein